MKLKKFSIFASLALTGLLAAGTTAFAHGAIESGMPDDRGMMNGNSDGMMNGIMNGNSDGMMNGTMNGNSDGMMSGMMNGNSDGMMNGMTNGNGENIMQGHYKQMVKFMEMEDMQDMHEDYQEESSK